MTPACDVYSLALTLYEAWTGTNPVRAGGPAATARRLGRPLPSLAALRRDLPLELCDAVDEALEIDPALRPAPSRLRAELQAAESELTDEGGLVEPATLRRVGLRERVAPPWVPVAPIARRAAGPRSGAARGRSPTGEAARARRRGPGRRWPRTGGARGPRPRSLLFAAGRCWDCRRRNRRAAAHRLADRGDRRLRLARLARGRPAGHRAAAARRGGPRSAPAPARGAALVGARARPAARNDRARSSLRRNRGARLHARTARRPRCGRPLVACAR